MYISLDMREQWRWASKHLLPEETNTSPGLARVIVKGAPVTASLVTGSCT
jgi:hypothetical protein